MLKGYFRIFISWLSHIFRETTFRSYKTVLAVLRLFRRCEVSGRKERTFREHGLALSSEPTVGQAKLPASMTLAVPLQSKGLQLQPPQNIITPLTTSSMPVPNISIPVPFTYPPPQPAASGQSLDISLIPIIPAEINRYGRKIPVDGRFLVFNIKKGHLGYSKKPTLETGWQPFAHPEGALFFYHPSKRVFTDANVRDPQIAAKVYRAAEKAYQDAHNAGVDLPVLVELGLELMDDGTLGYYFADHDQHVVFWSEDHESSLLMNNVRGVQHESHVRYAIESQYWKHIELFPNNRFLPKNDVARLKQVVMYSQADNITSDTSSAPFGQDQITNILTLMDPLMSSIDEEHEHAVWIVARFMRLFCRSQFINFYGQLGARLDVDQSLYGDPSTHPKNLIFHVMNFILFGFPGAHSEALHMIWVDETIVQRRWKSFIDRLNAEWNRHTIFSTVMLAVDISFLAIPSVQGQTAAILVAYLSTICTMGSLMISLVLTGQFDDTSLFLAHPVNGTPENNAEGVLHFMIHMTQSRLGLESLAFMLGLPFSLLIWGMIFFSAALSIIIFHTSDTVTISIASPIWATMVILAILPVLAANNIHVNSLRTWALKRVSNYSPA